MAKTPPPSPNEPRPDPSRDPAEEPRYHQWCGRKQRGGPGTFDRQARARFITAIAAHGRIGLACGIAGITDKTVTDWRRRGKSQLRALEEHERAQDEIAAADPQHQRVPYPGRLDAAEFLLDCERAAAWWEASHQDRLQQAAEAGEHSITMWLLNRHDRLQGRLKGTEVHEHHHHAPPQAIDKLEEIVARRAALRGEE